MPVRVKQRASKGNEAGVWGTDYTSLCRHITGILLAWGTPVLLSLRCQDNDHKMIVKPYKQPTSLSEPSRSSVLFDDALIRSILYHGTNIDPRDLKSWVKVSARTLFTTVRAIISLEPAPSKNTQFICLGSQFIGQENEGNVLYDEVNRIFSSSSFGVQEEQKFVDENVDGHKDTSASRRIGRGYAGKQFRGNTKGVDRWPMFFIRIEPFMGNAIQITQHLEMMEKKENLSSIVNVLGAMITSFLDENNFRPRQSSKRKRKEHGLLFTGSKSRKMVDFSSQNPMIDQNASAIVEQATKEVSPGTPDANPPDPSTIITRAVPLSFKDLEQSIKLPSFARQKNDRTHMDFSDWSRIKGGSRDSAISSSCHKKLQRAVESITGEVGAVTEGIHKESQSIAIDFLPKKLSTQACRKTYSPQADNTSKTDCNNPDRVVVHVQSLVNLNKPCSNNSEEVSDTVISWINPISKATILINARTGLILPQASLPRTATLANDRVRPQTAPVGPTQPLGLKRSLSDSLWKLPREDTWAGKFVANWENPVFRQAEKLIPQLMLEGPSLDTSRCRPCRHSQNDIINPFTDPSGMLATKLSKSGLSCATIYGQVDGKFILAKMPLISASITETSAGEDVDQVLVLIDQHAADERIRIEGLLEDLCHRPVPCPDDFKSPLNLISAIETSRLPDPIKLQLAVREGSLLQKYAQYFATWGILFDLNLDRSHFPRPGSAALYTTVTVLTLPPVIAERCRTDSKLLVKLLRTEIWKREDVEAGGLKFAVSPVQAYTGCSSDPHPLTPPTSSWVRRIADCPQGMLDLLNSRACRSAVMFNDELSWVDCETLVRRLAGCRFPFQCAHGRPSMVPLVSVGTESGTMVGNAKLATDFGDGLHEADFRQPWRKWRPSVS